jgi:hypothetical protein
MPSLKQVPVPLELRKTAVWEGPGAQSVSSADVATPTVVSASPKPPQPPIAVAVPTIHTKIVNLSIIVALLFVDAL